MFFLLSWAPLWSNKVNKLFSNHMVQWFLWPHTIFLSSRLRNQSKESFQARGVKLSFMPLFIKATSMALLHFPVLNSSVDAECENLTFKVSCVVKMLLRTLRDGRFSNHRTETNSPADKYFGHFQSSELNICLYIFFRVPTILVLPWILSKAY